MNFYTPDQVAVWLSNSAWVRLATLDFLRLEYRRVLQNIGVLKIDLPTSFPVTYLAEDAILEIYRGVQTTQYLDMETVWFIRDWEFALDDQGREIIQVTAYDTNFLLDSRIVAYKTSTTNANKSGAADDVMKAYVREQLTTATDTTRQITTYFQVAVDLGAGPTISKTAPHAKLLTILQEISQDATKEGTPIYFDVVALPLSRVMEFRTYKNYRGQDHGSNSGNRVVLSPEAGTLASVRRSYLTGQERNAAYVGGKGQDSARTVEVVLDSTRTGISPFNRRELFLNRSNTDDDELTAEGQATIRQFRPREVYSMNISENQNVRYGVHWKLGDIVSANYRGTSVNARVEGVKTLVQNGKIQTVAEVRVEA